MHRLPLEALQHDPHTGGFCQKHSLHAKEVQEQVGRTTLCVNLASFVYSSFTKSWSFWAVLRGGPAIALRGIALSAVKVS